LIEILTLIISFAILVILIINLTRKEKFSPFDDIYSNKLIPNEQLYIDVYNNSDMSFDINIINNELILHKYSVMSMGNTKIDYIYGNHPGQVIEYIFSPKDGSPSINLEIKKFMPYFYNIEITGNNGHYCINKVKCNF
jgi:hypothetical protein